MSGYFCKILVERFLRIGPILFVDSTQFPISDREAAPRLIGQGLGPPSFTLGLYTKCKVDVPIEKIVGKGSQ